MKPRGGRPLGLTWLETAQNERRKAAIAFTDRLVEVNKCYRSLYVRKGYPRQEISLFATDVAPELNTAITFNPQSSNSRQLQPHHKTNESTLATKDRVVTEGLRVTTRLFFPGLRFCEMLVNQLILVLLQKLRNLNFMWVIHFDLD